MGKAVVLAEKPSVAKDLARVLGCHKQGKGFFEGDRYVVTWALGHLVTLADPESYDAKYKNWSLEDLPIMPPALKLEVIKQTGGHFHNVKAQLLRKDVTEVVIATDAGREGELVARWILEKAGCRKPLKRLWISSVTDQAIRQGFNSLKPGKEYENLYASAQARAEADWLVGFNASRALTTRYQAQLSCGRVQTPTLAMIARREQEIQRFQPKAYYELTAQVKGWRLYWQDSRTQETRCFDEEKMNRLLQELKGKEGQVQEVSRTNKKVDAPPLYDLTELQRDANKRYGFSAKETLSIMQSLYETHKLLTYPRTDSRYLSSDLVATLSDRIKGCSSGPFAAIGNKAAARLDTVKEKLSCVNDSKVSDHHAIIPTEVRLSWGLLTDRERKVYDLVVRRFLAVFYPPFVYEQTTLKARIGSEQFTARGKVVVTEGWKAVYDLEEEEEEAGPSPHQLLPKVEKGQQLPVSGLTLHRSYTTPPPYFNEATLLSAMENPQRFLAEEERSLAKIIGETGGLGTVATRGDIIEKLFNSFLMERRGKEIHLTAKGRQLLELVPEELKSPALTGQWEQKLQSISQGRLKKEGFIGEMRSYTREVVAEIKAGEHVFRHDNLTKNKCPECGKYMLEVQGKKGKMLVCQDRECGHRKSVSRTTNARCPQCHKRMEMKGEGEAQAFHCACGYREKLSSFQKRKQETGNQASKREVARYLKEQQKEEKAPINTALADALSKLKLSGPKR